MKWILMALFLVGCSNLQVPKTIDEIQDVPVKETIEITQSVVPKEVVEVKKNSINIIKLTNFNAAEEARFRKIVANCQVVLHSPEFKEGILNHEWQGKKQFVDTTDTNEQVLAKLLSKDWELDYRIEWKIFGKTIGYTYPNVTWIVIYDKFFSKMKDSEVAANIFHEYGGHKLGGYDHAKYWSEARDYSAPYGIGYVAEKVYRNKFETE